MSTMAFPLRHANSVHHVALVGAGLIGCGWAAHFLARGFSVAIYDVDSAAEARVAAYLERVWPALMQLGLVPGAARDRWTFSSDLESVLAAADFVQESSPERLDLKRQLWADIDALVPPDVVIASSSSGLTASQLQSACRAPGRCVVGHPFNPPHLIPLVEIVGGAHTDPATVAFASEFYALTGKKPIVLRREIAGHAANRLQAALWREALHLVAEGVLDVREVDDAVSWGPGLRWALMGPNQTFHLGGGAGGMEHFLAHLAGPFTRWWEDLGTPELTDSLRRQLVDGVRAQAAGRTVAELEAQRDAALLGLLMLRHESESKV